MADDIKQHSGASTNIMTLLDGNAGVLLQIIPFPHPLASFAVHHSLIFRQRKCEALTLSLNKNQ
jgi:hypothetical protein